ncbi:MAG: DUF885 domain-containing protein [Pirellulales bacterium]|nr:DUF885 domain-containing protein [Pirellulales bacterium]
MQDPALSQPQQQPTAGEQLQALFAESWAEDLKFDPLFATHCGVHDYNHLLPNVLPEAEAAYAARNRQFLQRLAAIDRSRLAPQDQISYDVFRRLKQDALAEFELGAWRMPITNREGFHIYFPELRRQMPLATTDDYEDYLARLAAFGTYTDQHIELLRRAIADQWTLPAAVLNGFERPLEAHLVDQPEQSLFYEPFLHFPPGVPEPEHARLRQAARHAISTVVIPAYARFLAFMRDEYVPAARGSEGISAVPGGREFYRHRVRKFTTLDVTPEEVHQIGLDEVARIRAEMEEVLRQTSFSGDLAAFIDHLRSDKRFYARTPDELLKEVALVLKRMDGELPRLFRTLPRMPYGIRPVPDYVAPLTTTAYYSPPAGDGTRAGYYYVNTYALESRPLYEIEALSLHEAVPGHHLQIALQQELADLPAFQRFAGITAFVEGWALYAERLGLEVGFYQDPYSNFGRLSYEMWRACRLVVDTGIHYLGWSRQQAIDFMAQNTALAQHNIVAEVDRYIAWPGQALAYKMGELKIRELRARAEARLGPAFDLREFHEVILSSGALPLDVLEAKVERYLQR